MYPTTDTKRIQSDSKHFEPSFKENLMSTAMLGGELETMATLKGKLNEQANTVATLTSTVDQQVKNTVWSGPAADRFRELWDGQFKQTLEQLRIALNDAASEVSNRAEAIRVATA
jgi:uncharacterized protein YukE